MMKNSLVMLCWRAAQCRPGRSGAMAMPPTGGGGAAARMATPMMAGGGVAARTVQIGDAGPCLGQRGGGGDGVAARRTAAGAGAAPGTERQH